MDNISNVFEKQKLGYMDNYFSTWDLDNSGLKFDFMNLILSAFCFTTVLILKKIVGSSKFV